MIQSRLKQILDRKSWEFMTPPVIASAAGQFIVYDKSGFDRDALLFTAAGATAYSYDHNDDAWLTLPATGLTGTTPTLTGANGDYSIRGPLTYCAPINTQNSINVPLVIKSNLIGYYIRIIGGTGAGQERIISKTVFGDTRYTITTTLNSSTCTLTGPSNINNVNPGALLIGNANIPVGTQVTAVTGTTTFTVITPQGSETTPGTGIAAATGIQTCIGGTLYVSQPWTTVPDFSSIVVLYTGRWYAQIGASTITNNCIGFYDRATAIWATGSIPGTIQQPGWGTALATNYGLGIAWGTDAVMCTTQSNKAADFGSIIGTSTNTNGPSNTINTLVDTTKNWKYNTYRGYADMIMITGGTGVGQVRAIIGNGSNYVNVNPAWSTIPDNTSTYMITESSISYSATASAGSTSTDIKGSFTYNNKWTNYPIRIISGKGVNGIGLITSNTPTDLTVSGLSSADSTSVYGIMSPLGQGGLLSSGTGDSTYTISFFGTPFSANHLTNVPFQVAIIGGAGAGQVRNIIANTNSTLTVSPVLTTKADSTSSICLLHPALSSSYPFYSFCTGIATSGTATTLVASKNWQTNQWTNYQLRIIAGTGAGTIRLITSNSSNTLTVTVPFSSSVNVTTTSNSLTATTSAFADTRINPGLTMSGNGAITSNSTVGPFLSSTTFQINNPTGNATLITAGGPTATTFGVNPDATSFFVIEAFDNQLILGGNAAVTLYRMNLDYLHWVGAVPYFYTLPATNARAAAPSAGASFEWIAEQDASAWQDETNIINGRRIYSFRSGAVGTLDYYDLALGTWFSNIFYRSNGETFTTGTKYWGEHGEIYIQKDATGRFFRFNVADLELKAWSTLLYPQGAAMLGNTMWIRKVQDMDILRWVYFIPNTLQALFRCLAIDKIE